MITGKFLQNAVTFISIFFIISKSFVYSQSTWQWIHPDPTGNFLYSVYFTDRYTGYAAGSFGTIIRTTNGGKEWSKQNLNITQDLSEVTFINQSTGIAVGKSGVILKTTNAGESWLMKNSNTTAYLHDVTFPVSNTGYAVALNGVILKTTDMGNNWMYLTTGATEALFSVDFLNQNTGIAGGYNIILKTTNGGLNWINENADVVPGSSIVGISITDDQMVAVGNSPGGIFYKKTNQGISWESNSLGLPYLFGGSVDLVRGLDFFNSNTGYVVTDFGTILKTINGGISWIRDSSFRPSYEKLSVMYDISVLDSDIINIAGNGGNVMKSSDGGLNWLAQSGNKKTLRGNYFINSLQILFIFFNK